MAHQHIPKIFHGPCKKPPLPRSYILNVQSLIKKVYLQQIRQKAITQTPLIRRQFSQYVCKCLISVLLTNAVTLKNHG